jgi:hypothetical protein
LPKQKSLVADAAGSVMHVMCPRRPPIANWVSAVDDARLTTLQKTSPSTDFKVEV